MDLPLFRILGLGMLGTYFSRRHFEIFFFLFPENRLCHFMQNVKGDNFHEMSYPILGENGFKGHYF